MSNTGVAHYVGMESCHWNECTTELSQHNHTDSVSINRIQSFQKPNLKTKPTKFAEQTDYQLIEMR